MGERPDLPLRLERQRQYARQPRRCQRNTVSGFTISNDLRQPANHRHASTQNRRSASRMRGRGCRRRSQQLLSQANVLRHQEARALKPAAIPHPTQRSTGPSLFFFPEEGADTHEPSRED